jgi:hypothetical protein
MCHYLYMHVVITFNNVCANLETPSQGAQIWDSQAKQWLWEKSEGVYKQSHLQKRVMLSVYWEHGDKVGLASAPATHQQLKYRVGRSIVD